MSVEGLKSLYVLFLIDLARKAPSDEVRTGLFERIERAIASQPEVRYCIEPIVYPLRWRT
jgi:hypothetical protein